jgi:hypothetical protein
MRRLTVAVIAASLLMSQTASAEDRVLLESNSDAGSGSEVYLVNYPTDNDLLTNAIGTQGFLPLDINPVFSVGDFAFDGSYHVLLESNADAAGLNEVYLLSYDTFGDLQTNTIGTQGFLPLDINPVFSIGGFAFNDGLYQVLLESNADAAGLNEVYLLNYNTFGDLQTNTIGTQGFLPLDINPVFSMGGYEVDTPRGGGGAVPEPATWLTVLIGFGLVGSQMRKRRFALA